MSVVRKLKYKIQNGELSIVDITKKAIEKAKEKSHLNAFISLTEELALKQAEELQEKVKKGEELKLFGLPVAVKDNINVKGYETTCGSKILKGYVSPYNATVVEKLIKNGAVIIGKANMDEFAFGSTNETSAFGEVKNPYDTERVPGGSSGGSAVSVAADIVPFALGSDTGGSIRQPAAFCGVVGIKPTYGRVSRYGLVAFGSSLDQIGPFSYDVCGAGLLLETISGFDKNDSTSVDKPAEFKPELKDLKGLKVGVIEEYAEQIQQEEIKEVYYKVLDYLKASGAEIIKLEMPHIKYSIATYYILATSEASSNLARFDGVRYGNRVNSDNVKDMYLKTRSEGFGEEVKRRILLGTFALSSGYYDAYYLRALAVRKLIAKDFEKAFEKVDFIFTPATPTTAFKLGEKINNPLEMYLSDIFTVPVNLAGVPALTLPIDFSKDGLPIGMQFISKWFDEKTMLDIAYTVEDYYKFYEKAGYGKF